MAMRPVAIGLRSKTGRALTVVVGRDESGRPQVLDRREIPTCDPDVPASHQPHHAGLDLPAEEARPIVAAAESAARAAAQASFVALRKELRSLGLRALAVGVVGPPVRDPASIGSPHMRAHAAEGQLFRAVLEEAARKARLRCQTLSDRSAWEDAASDLGADPGRLRAEIQPLGKALGPPWRADHQLACLAGWVALSSREDA